MAYFPREIYFLVAAVSTKNPYLNFFLRNVNFIPTKRPQDEVYLGTGVIQSVAGNVLKGKGTIFTKNFNSKDTISINDLKAFFFVTKIIDDETAEIDNSKQVAFEGKELAFQVIPKLDQTKVFDSSWQLLRDGKVVGIFPEVGF